MLQCSHSPINKQTQQPFPTALPHSVTVQVGSEEFVPNGTNQGPLQKAECNYQNCNLAGTPDLVPQFFQKMRWFYALSKS